MPNQPPISSDRYGDKPEGRIAVIMRMVKTIAVVGASNKPERPSYRALLFFANHGFDVIAVNPGLAEKDIAGIEVVATLADINRQVDMVDVFRASDALPAIVDEAIAIGATVLWTQLGVIHDAAAKKAEEAGMMVVVNRCPMIEFAGGF